MISLSYLSPIRKFAESDAWVDDNKLWIQVYPYDTWDHPIYGPTTIDKNKASNFVENFQSNVRGQEIPISYEHGLDPAKGTKAAGWVREVEARDDGFYAFVEFTEPAKKEIEDGEWKYFSGEHWEDWTHPQTKQEFKNVFDGAGLTNKPWVKGMVPINLSELVTEKDEYREFAVWTTAYINDLPDSCFAYIESGGKKDSGGKTFPRSLRHFPYKDASGKIDMNHVRNAIARAPQANVPASIKTMVQNKMRRLLGSKNQSEMAAIDSEVITMDDATEQALRTALGINEEADLVATVSSLIEEVGPLRTFAEEHRAKKQFSEMFPAEAKRMAELEVSNRNNAARQFSESLKTKRFKIGDGDEAKDTTQGLSGLAITEIEEAHKKFSEGVGGLDTFVGAVNAIFDNGIVNYGENGSSQGKGDESETFEDQSVNDYQEARRLFSERVDAILAEPDNKEMKYNEAMAIAGMKYPKLYESYRRPPVSA